MKIATPLVTILLAAFSVGFARQAKRAWRDPDWEPASAAQSPRSPVALAILFISFAVALAGGSVFTDLPGMAAKDTGAALAGAGFLGLMFAVVTTETTKRYRVLIDGRKAATIRPGRQVELPVPPGRHVIHLRPVWAGSQFIPFQVRAGQVLRFGCEPGGFPGMTQADMERDVTGYIRLRRLR